MAYSQSNYIALLHERYEGTQDVFFKKYDESTRPKIGNVLETKTVLLPVKDVINYNFHTDTNNPNVAYTNLKFNSTNSINHITLIIGEQVFEKAYLFKYVDTMPVMDTLTFPNCIPRLENHPITIKIVCDVTNPDDTLVMTYDIVELNEPKDSYQSLVYHEQYTGEEVIDDGTEQTIILNYNHPIVCLYAFLPNNVVSARLMLDGNDHNLLFTKEKGTNYHILEFGKETSINFSRIEKIKLVFTTETPNDGFGVRVYGISKQMIQYSKGMAGMMFSK